MQVVYNNQFGGFSLSNKALVLLSEYKGIKLDNYLASELPRHDPDLIKVIEKDGREEVVEPDLNGFIKVN